MIRFNHPHRVGRELEYVKEAVEAGRLSTGGPFARRCADLLADAHGSNDALMTTSCTDALEMTALLLDLEHGDSVIVPSFTFTSTALAYARQGIRVKFADIESLRLGIDPSSVEELIDDTVRAVVCVHYAGVACDLDGLAAVLDRHPNVALIEDNAHGLFGTHGGKPLGTFGRFSTLSFHETKNFQCGEGGALLVNEPFDVDRAHVLYDKGTNRRAFMLGQVDKYSWQDTGSSFGMSDLQAAFLFGQLEQSDFVLADRRRVWNRYHGGFGEHLSAFGIRRPHVPDGDANAYHMYYLLCRDRAQRDDLLASLLEAGVHATFHYVPLHSSPAAARFSDTDFDCPVTDDVSGRLIRLPFYTLMADEDIDRVIEAVHESLHRRSD